MKHIKPLFIQIVLISCILLIGLCIGSRIAFKNYKQSLFLVTYQLNDQILLRLINEWRLQENRQPLINNNELCQMAKIRIYDIQRNFSHAGFNTLASKLFPTSHIGENLIMGAYSEQSALTSWLNSASHAVNLRFPYKSTCITTYKNTAVQLFSDF